MNFTNKVKSCLLIGFTSLTLISCNYIFENNTDKIEKENEKIARINIDKKEAKLLLKASKNNLEILELCKIITGFDTQNNVERLAENLKNTHMEISKSYSDLAREKLISIPSYTTLNNEIEMTEFDSMVFVKTNLKRILGKINQQILMLDTLTKTTDNLDFKILAVRDNHILKTNINKIEYILKGLNKSL